MVKGTDRKLADKDQIENDENTGTILHTNSTPKGLKRRKQPGSTRESNTGELETR